MDKPAPQPAFRLATAALLGAAAAVAIYLVSGAGSLLDTGVAEHARALFWHAAAGAAAFALGAILHNKTIGRVSHTGASS